MAAETKKTVQIDSFTNMMLMQANPLALLTLCKQFNIEITLNEMMGFMIRNQIIESLASLPETETDNVKKIALFAGMSQKGGAGGMDPMMLMMMGNGGNMDPMTMMMLQGQQGGKGIDPMMLMMMNQGKNGAAAGGMDMGKFMMMNQMMAGGKNGSAGGMDPMMMMLMNGGKIDPMMMMLMSQKGGNPFGGSKTASADNGNGKSY